MLFSVGTDDRRHPLLYNVGHFLRRAKKSKPAVIGAAIVLFFAAVAIFAPLIAPHDPVEQHEDGFDMGMPHEPFSEWKFPLGTDHLGRDVLSRVIHGTRISLFVGFSAMAYATVIGVVLGILSGYFGRHLDMVIMRIVDTIMAFPSFILVMATVGSLEPGVLTLLFAIGIVRWAAMARLARSQALQVKELNYVEAGRAIGVHDIRIMLRYILPNSLAPIIVSLTMGIAGCILMEASLSFLGLGVQPPTPSWGMMINETRAYMFLRPSLVFIPSLAIAVTVLGFSLLGDGLRDILDPRLRGEG